MLLLLLAALTAPAAGPIAQTITVATETLSLTSDGKPSRCEIDFSAIVRDDVDEPGKLLGVKGTFGLELLPGKPLFQLVKVSYKDIEGEHIGPDQAPYSVSLVGTSGKSNVAYRAYQAPGENGSLLASFLLHDQDEVMQQIVVARRLKLLFNRREGAGDVLVDVDLFVLDSNGAKERRGSDTLRSFANCSVALLDEAKIRLDAEHDRQVATTVAGSTKFR